MKKYYGLLAILLLVSPLGYSANGSFTIKGIGASNYSKTIYITVAETVAQSPCNKSNGFRLKTTGDNSMHKEILSILLTAQTTDKKVSINYSTKASDCIADVPLISTVFIKS